MEEREEKKSGFEEFVYQNRIPVVIFLGGLVLLGAAILLSKQVVSEDKVKLLQSTTEVQEGPSEIVVEMAGQVVSPGVYLLDQGSRINDGLIAAGGLTVDADRTWVEKNLNKAAKLTDGAKIYIPATNEQSNGSSASSGGGIQTVSLPRGSGLVNINSATQSELEALPGIGPVYAQSIIEHRPYSTTEELLSSGALKKSTYEKVKDSVSVY